MPGAAGARRAPASCPADGKNGVAELHRDWLMTGWDRKAGDPAFNFREDLGRFLAVVRGFVVAGYADDDPLNLTAHIWKSSFVLGSRFHSLVAALSGGVPVIMTGAETISASDDTYSPESGASSLCSV